MIKKAKLGIEVFLKKLLTKLGFDIIFAEIY